MSAQSKTTISQENILAARQGLIPTREQKWLGGFGNMLRKELGQWWGTRTWWVQTLIWVLILNGVSTIVMLTEAGSPAQRLQEVIQTFLPMAVALVGIGTVITAQGAIVGEKQLGTAAWVMSKPASRSAFILAKILAYTIGFWTTSIILPSIIFFITVGALIPLPLALTSFLAGVGIALLSQLFYLALTVMLGTFYNSRGPIAGIGIGFFMTGLLLKSFIPMQVLIATPWPLPDVAAGLALGSELPSIWPMPIAATAVLTLVMIFLALWRFEREEF
ncbi:MAG: ABC transporter permease subunit [Chloroflexota bacterium]